MPTQQEITHYIEELMFFLTEKANGRQFEEILKKNIAEKKQAAVNEEHFFDRLMLSITYFVENQVAWKKIMLDTYGKGHVPKVSFIEGEVLAQQMRIRESIAEKTEAYCKMFHSQYKGLQVTEEAVVYDYAYASVAHSLRFDFLTYVTMQPRASMLLGGEFEETLRVIEGYIAYYSDQMVNPMQLVE